MDIWNQPSFWDGTGGAIIGAISSLGVALVVLWATRRHDMNMAQRSRSLDVATQMLEPIDRWQDVVRKADAAISVGRAILAEGKTLHPAYYENTRDVLRRAEDACDEVYRTVKARAIQIDDLTMQRRLLVTAMRISVSGSYLTQARMDDPFDPFVEKYAEESQHAAKSLGDLEKLLLSCLKVEPKKRGVARGLRSVFRRLRPKKRQK